MQRPVDYIEKNKALWNTRTEYHFRSLFYNVEDFIAGKSSLNNIELDLLGDVAQKTVLHLQCHFGQDTLSLARLGALATGVDLSDNAIEKAQNLAKQLKLAARFICCNLYDLRNYLHEKFDIVYTSYGTIGWLPDLKEWAGLIADFLKPGGSLIFVEFHPVVWMFNNDFDKIEHSYFRRDAIIELEEGTYADNSAPINLESVTWNHAISEVCGAILHSGFQIDSLKEYDYSPYNCFKHTLQQGEKKFVIKHLANNIPMVYSIVATLKNA